MNRFDAKAKYIIMAFATVNTVGQALGANMEKILSFSAGPLTIRPHLDISERFDDNVYLVSSKWGPESDLITSFSPGIKVSLGNDIPYRPLSEDDALEVEERQESHLTFAYTWTKSIYASHTELNAGDHNFSLNGFYKGNRVTIDGVNSFEMLNSILGGPLSLNRTVERSNQSHSYKINYQISERTSSYLQGSFNQTDFQNKVLLYDQNTFRGTLGISLKPFERIGFFGETYYGQSAISPNNVLLPEGPYLNFIGGFIGVNGQFTPRISGQIKAGYEMREFGNGQKADDSPVVDIDVQYRITDRILTTVFYSRSANVSMQIADTFYVSDTVGIRYSHQLGRNSKWTFRASTTYNSMSYGDTGFYASRTDDWLRLSGGIGYAIRLWMNAGLDYEFDSFDSNFKDKGVIDYRANRVTLRLSIGY